MKLLIGGLNLNELHKIFGRDTSSDMQLLGRVALKRLGVKVPLVKMRSLFAMFDEDETGQVEARRSSASSSIPSTI